MNSIRKKGKIIVELQSYNSRTREGIKLVLNKIIPDFNSNSDVLEISKFIEKNDKIIDVEGLINQVIVYNKRIKQRSDIIDIDECIFKARKFASFIEKNKKKIINILTLYETHEVAEDEINRSLDILLNLNENEEYFKRRIGRVVSFLPRNQPLYAFCCFVIIPSLMSKMVSIRVPNLMSFFLTKLLDCLKINQFFNNIEIYTCGRKEFMKEVTKDTEAVIFTGNFKNAKILIPYFPKDVVILVGGAGHNPIIVTESANIKKAVESSLRVQLYNQGQDCANPSAILVHQKNHQEFLKLLIERIRKIKVGEYKNPYVKVGPITDSNDLIRIQRVFVEEREWLRPETKGIIITRNKIVEPTIIDKPLSIGGNYKEQFAPLFYVQKYKNDNDLKMYFENRDYEQQAMYITIFGHSKYIEEKVNKGWKFHPSKTIIKNTDLHALGIERGTQEYGGYGIGSSCVIVDGKNYPQPILPQRELYNYLVKNSFEEEDFIPERVKKIINDF